ncbi:DUF3040 domain-containing protein [Pseudonocardia sp. MH-G8]|uniref:DUF3040 domain-containing protein n=1 Tax=Pseudonocardia sp. MH-G8 TaxID=1854588 RepID=UPI000BA145EF|nr:DUF3040 domain-containing protein [Pseudonocardia sp. MH-G8]OZM81372.1 hypothetical protein CFP66_14510 [Pseudonocardia sp. MH-G8]
MLNQNDRRRLEAIERQLRDEDPEFARRFSHWPPEGTRRWRSWPVLVLVLGCLGVLLALVVLSPALFLLSAAGVTAGWIGLARRHRKEAGPPGDSPSLW